MSKQVEVTVSGIIFNQNKQVLLCKSPKWNNQWVIPGGHVEYGERLEEALIREMKEETGLTVYDVKLVSLQESIADPSFHESRHMLYVDFSCATDQNDVLLNDEADEFKWVDLADVLTFDLGGFLPQLFDQMINKKAQHEYPVYFGYSN